MDNKLAQKLFETAQVRLIQPTRSSVLSAAPSHYDRLWSNLADTNLAIRSTLKQLVKHKIKSKRTVSHPLVKVIASLLREPLVFDSCKALLIESLHLIQSKVAQDSQLDISRSTAGELDIPSERSCLAHSTLNHTFSESERSETTRTLGPSHSHEPK